MPDPTAGIVFVHGAFVRDGDWWWRPTADLVERATGVRSHAVALPSCGEGDHVGGGNGLAADARALRRALDLADGPAVVVGHSYGGTVIAEGADHPAAGHLLYLSSYLPEIGVTQSDTMGAEDDPVTVAPHDDGTLSVTGYDRDSFARRFLHDVADPRVREDAWHRVTRQQASAFLTPTTAAAWRGRPSTYLVCTEDRSTSVALQRTHAARATYAVDLPTGHHPFLSRPDLVAAEILTILDRGR